VGISIGIVGLPNVGNSTTFNALTKTANAQSENYPFCTIEPNKALVSVPDIRLEELAKFVGSEVYVPTVMEFVDIAGLVKGASKGEGLGNQFLSNIKETDAILHIVRAFEDENITHVDGNIDPIRDIEVIETELLLADISTLERRIEKLTKTAKSGDKSAKAQLEVANKLLEFMNEGNQASAFEDKNSDAFLQLNKALRFLTNKNMIYGANVDEDALSKDNEFVQKIKEYAKDKNREVIKLCAKLEEDMIDMEDEERDEFLQELGANESGLSQITRKSFEILGLISYFTAGVKEVRSWTIKKGYKAPKAASVIHNDFEKGFIKAEVISYEDFIKSKGEQKAKELGLMRLEGKDYVVQDGDIVHFRFNV